LQNIPQGSEADVKAAVVSARRAFDDGRWRLLPPSTRQNILFTFAALIDKHAEELDRLDALAMGKPMPIAFANANDAAKLVRTNGITEGFHNKMEMMSRRAYGFRNFENYRLRVLTHCGWDGITNRVR
jgi:acyl-CoA reductase-like NAD-dependent aldehyde dehydrogenase